MIRGALTGIVLLGFAVVATLVSPDQATGTCENTRAAQTVPVYVGYHTGEGETCGEEEAPCGGSLINRYRIDWVCVDEENTSCGPNEDPIPKDFIANTECIEGHCVPVLPWVWVDDYQPNETKQTYNCS